jgi:hypothetical protein
MIVRMIAPTYEHTIRRVQVTDASTALAAAALRARKQALAANSYPEHIDLPQSPFTGERAVYKRLPDGGALLAFPESEKMWKVTLQKDWLALPPRLSWSLPAIKKPE